MKHNILLSLVIMLMMATSCSGKTNGNQAGANEDSSKTATQLTDAPVDIQEAEAVAADAKASAKSGEDKVSTRLLSNGKPTVIDFTAVWCGPCKMMKPIFHTLANEYGDKINFVSIDIDENPELANKYQVQAVPTFVFLDEDGKEANRITGADPENLAKEIASGMWY